MHVENPSVMEKSPTHSAAAIPSGGPTSLTPPPSGFLACPVVPGSGGGGGRRISVGSNPTAWSRRETLCPTHLVGHGTLVEQQRVSQLLAGRQLRLPRFQLCLQALVVVHEHLHRGHIPAMGSRPGSEPRTWARQSPWASPTRAPKQWPRFQAIGTHFL